MLSFVLDAANCSFVYYNWNLENEIIIRMTTDNDEDRVSNDIKIPECDLNMEKYFQRKIKFQAFLRVKGFQDTLNR